jgi:hypothetical protein
MITKHAHSHRRRRSTFASRTASSTGIAPSPPSFAALPSNGLPTNEPARGGGAADGAPSASSLAEQLLYVGDTIILDVEGGESVATTGLSDASVVVRPSTTAWHETAFVVRPQQNYAAEKALLHELEARGLSVEQGSASAELRHLYEARASERQINEGEFRQKRGQQVRVDARRRESGSGVLARACAAASLSRSPLT